FLAQFGLLLVPAFLLDPLLLETFLQVDLLLLLHLVRDGLRRRWQGDWRFLRLQDFWNRRRDRRRCGHYGRRLWNRLHRWLRRRRGWFDFGRRGLRFRSRRRGLCRC